MAFSKTWSTSQDVDVKYQVSNVDVNVSRMHHFLENATFDLYVNITDDDFMAFHRKITKM